MRSFVLLMPQDFLNAQDGKMKSAQSEKTRASRNTRPSLEVPVTE